jgi:hypothetical protein
MPIETGFGSGGRCKNFTLLPKAVTKVCRTGHTGPGFDGRHAVTFLNHPRFLFYLRKAMFVTKYLLFVFAIQLAGTVSSSLKFRVTPGVSARCPMRSARSIRSGLRPMAIRRPAILTNRVWRNGSLFP